MKDKVFLAALAMCLIGMAILVYMWIMDSKYTEAGPRSGHSALLLEDGRLLIIGGMRIESPIFSFLGSRQTRSSRPEIYDPMHARWSSLGDETDVDLYDLFSFLLPGKKVLLISTTYRQDKEEPTEVFDLKNGSYATTGSVRLRAYPAQMLDGNILMVGGFDKSVRSMSTNKCQLFDCPSSHWIETIPMGQSRAFCWAGTLTNGEVLVLGGKTIGYTVTSGGITTTYLDSCELFDPKTKAWRETGKLIEPVDEPVAITLKDGRVLLCEGFLEGNGVTADPNVSCEIYDPKIGTWKKTGDTLKAHIRAPIVTLSDGRVMIVGGENTTLCEIFDPATEKWTSTGMLHLARAAYTATTLPDGKVIVVGGYDQHSKSSLNECEVYDPVTGTWNVL
jgi:hypothetical protein